MTDRKAQLWRVITPEYGVVVPVTDEGQGPLEYGCDVIEIEAESRRGAIVIGVREMLRGSTGGHGRGMRYQWCRDQRADGLSPYAGVRAEEVNVALEAHYDTCGLCGEGEICDVGRSLDTGGR